MNRWALPCVVVLAAVLAGCPQDRYEIELTPKADVVERTLTVWREKEPISPERLKAIAKAYAKPPKELDDDKHRFTGRFGDAMPNDVGGAGSYARYAARMGSTYVYVERFRGNDDLAGRLEEIVKSADRTVDQLLGWFKAEMGKAEGFPALRKFMDTQLRRDLRNLAIYMWTSHIEGGTLETAGVRAGQYFAERGYFKVKEVPRLLRALAAVMAAATDGDDEGEGEAVATRPAGPPPEERMMTVIRRLLARKMGVAADKPIPASLDFLKDFEAAKKSADKYFRTTDEFAEAMAEWKKEKQTDPEAEPPKPWDVIDLDLDIELVLFGSSDTVSVSLAARDEPFLTNGSYDEKERRITWAHAIKPLKDKQLRPPAICYAVWAEPDAAFQKERLGKVVLTGQSLADYCTWRASMAEPEAAEWDAFVNTLKPAKALADKLKAFKFSAKVVRAHHGGDAEQAEKFLDRGRDRLFEALKPKDKTE